MPPTLFRCIPSNCNFECKAEFNEWRDSAVRCYTATRNRKAYLLFKPALRISPPSRVSVWSFDHNYVLTTTTSTNTAYLLFKPALPPSSYQLSALSQFCRHQVVGHLQCHKRHVPSFTNYIRIRIRLSKYYSLTSVYDRYHILFLDAIASPSTYPCQWVGQ